MLCAVVVAVISYGYNKFFTKHAVDSSLPRCFISFELDLDQFTQSVRKSVLEKTKPTGEKGLRGRSILGEITLPVAIKSNPELPSRIFKFYLYFPTLDPEEAAAYVDGRSGEKLEFLKLTSKVRGHGNLKGCSNIKYSLRELPATLYWLKFKYRDLDRDGKKYTFYEGSPTKWSSLWFKKNNSIDVVRRSVNSIDFAVKFESVMDIPFGLSLK